MICAIFNFPQNVLGSRTPLRVLHRSLNPKIGSSQKILGGRDLCVSILIGSPEEQSDKG